MNYNGEWGTVCNDGWDDIDAGVVCRQLGFGPVGKAFGSTHLPNPMLLDGVACTSGETTLASCAHYGVNITKNCKHARVAGVNCTTQGTYIQSVWQVCIWWY